MQTKVDALHEIARAWKRSLHDIDDSKTQRSRAWEHGRISAFEESAAWILTERAERESGTVVMLVSHHDAREAMRKLLES